MAERNAAVPIKAEPMSTGNDVVSWPNPVQEISESVGLENSEPVSDSTEKARQAVEEGVAAVKRSFRAAENKSRQAASTVVERVRIMAREQPLQFLAAVAGIAFVTGVVLRIWRSSYE